jgi:major membrane immunogen (membrane-anchored lipoprotein)
MFDTKSAASSVRLVAAVLVSAGLLTACGQSEKFNRAAYEVCLADAKKAGSRLASASFAKFEDAKVASSTGDDQFRVNIPYEMNGQKGLFQCIAEKNRDGSFKVAED